jgi:mannose-6-phosphate isomerase-like protein (cupin superfamily)
MSDYSGCDVPIDLSDRYVHLAADGASKVVPGGTAFWALPAPEIEAFGKGWLVAEFECSEDWPNWEMHPQADEVVVLLSGSIELLVEHEAGVEATRIRHRGTVVVPKGRWHTARVFEPSRLLHITMGAGTKHRKVVAGA